MIRQVLMSTLSGKDSGVFPEWDRNSVNSFNSANLAKSIVH